MKITDLKCAVIGKSPIVRITTDEGIEGWGEVESMKPYLKPMILFYKQYLLGQDPTDVERVMLRIRRMGSFKPWGSAASAIEVALWDIAGKAAGVPVYKLLGGKVRDQVRCYNGGVRFKQDGWTPQAFADHAAKIKAAKEGFTLVKMPMSFHMPMAMEVPNFMYDSGPAPSHSDRRGLLTERGMNLHIECVEAMKDVFGDEVGLALDCGPGWTVPDAIRFAQAVEPFNLAWLEDLITGDYRPYVMADVFREVTRATSTPIHTGEQIYLRHHFRELLEQKAVNIVGPDPLDVGGIAELKWIAEYADLHGVLMAPHGMFDGLIGLAAHVQMGAALPYNFIAFEYPLGHQPDWWYDIVEGLPETIVKDGLIDVWDRPGLGVNLIADKAEQYLKEEDKGFFDD